MLKSLHSLFPALKIVLEHCTTEVAIEAVKECGPNVVGTITAHRLYLVVDDWADGAFCYWLVAPSPSPA
jgi:dihydroorotase